MRMEVERYRILIIPEDDTDVAYIEEVMRLEVEDDVCVCRRENVIGLSAIAYIEIKKMEGKE